MSFSAKDVKELREKTGAGMMDCKKALSENNGDMEKAIDFLRAKGLAAAAKKQSRIAAEGLIGTYVSGNTGVVVEVNCETDFVAKNDDFKNFVSTLSEKVAATKPANLEGLLEQKNNGNTVQETVNELTLKIGEKIAVRRFDVVETEGGIGNYVHGGKIGVLVEAVPGNASNVNNDVFQNYLKDVCMHVAASDPKFIDANDIDEDFKKKEAEIYAAQLKEQGKPDNMIPNIVKGKLNKLATEVCLLEQKFVKNPDVSIKQLTKEVGDQLGDTISLKRFVKYNLGEGIEKKQDNLAEEVAKMSGN